MAVFASMQVVTLLGTATADCAEQGAAEGGFGLSQESRYNVSAVLGSVKRLQWSQLADLLSALVRFGKYPPPELTNLLQRQSTIAIRSWFVGCSYDRMLHPIPLQEEARHLLSAASMLGFKLPPAYLFSCGQTLLSHKDFSLEDAALCLGPQQTLQTANDMEPHIPECMSQHISQLEKPTPAADPAGASVVVQPQLWRLCTAVVGFLNLHPTVAQRHSAFLERTIQIINNSKSVQAQAQLLQELSLKPGVLRNASGMWPFVVAMLGRLAPPSLAAAEQVGRCLAGMYSSTYSNVFRCMSTCFLASTSMAVATLHSHVCRHASAET